MEYLDYLNAQNSPRKLSRTTFVTPWLLVGSLIPVERPSSTLWPETEIEAAKREGKALVNLAAFAILVAAAVGGND